MSAYREGRTLRTIVTESKSGRQAWRAPVFIDTTGDGECIARGGSWFDRPEMATVPSRVIYPPYQRVFNVGFRLVIEDPTTTATNQ